MAKNTQPTWAEIGASALRRGDLELEEPHAMAVAVAALAPLGADALAFYCEAINPHATEDEKSRAEDAFLQICKDTDSLNARWSGGGR